MTIAEKKELILLKQRHRTLIHACIELVLAHQRGAIVTQEHSITEIQDLLKKWELTE